MSIKNAAASISELEEFVYTRSTDSTVTLVASTEASSAGWNGSAPLRVVLDGCFIISGSPSLPALDLRGSFPNGLTLQINSGTCVMGRGGRAINGFTSSICNGGHAILINTDITVELSSANLTNNRASAFIYGGGGAGGNIFFRDYDSGSKGASYQYYYCIGGGGAGGGGNYGNALGPSTINTTGYAGSTSGTMSAAASNVLHSPRYAYPSGFACSMIVYASTPELSSNFYLYGTTGGTYTDVTSSWSFSYHYHPSGSGYGYCKIGTAYPDLSAASSTGTLASSSLQKAILASGCGGGYGGNGGVAYAAEDYTDSQFTVGTYTAGSGGSAIKKQSGTETITFTGDISPSSSFSSAVCRFLGSYT